MEIYTDGACVPNPGPGGWGALLRFNGHERELSGGEATETTNNRMELTAPIRALESLTRKVPVAIYTDSTYVRNGITQWVAGWRKRGWMTSTNTPVENVDLWKRLDALVSEHEVRWHWVKGHSGHAENERADRLAFKGLQDSMRAAGMAVVQESPAVAPERKKRVPGPIGEGSCRAVTKKGTPCPVTPRPSGLCHVHDPEVQCGVTKRNGRPCAIATGGGRCDYHR